MKINFNFIKNSHLLKQYANKLPLIFDQYRLGNYNNAVEGIGSVLNQVVIDILTVESVSDKSLETAKNLEYLKNAGIYPEAIINDISMIIHGTESAKKDNTITEQDFLTQLASLHDLFAFLANIYENANIKYWDVQLAYKSSADKNGLFKQREIKNELPIVDVKLDSNLNLDFDSRVVRAAKKQTEIHRQEHVKPEHTKTKIPHRVQHVEKSKAIIKPKGKVAPVKIESRTARNKAKSKKEEIDLLV